MYPRVIFCDWNLRMEIAFRSYDQMRDSYTWTECSFLSEECFPLTTRDWEGHNSLLLFGELSQRHSIMSFRWWETNFKENNTRQPEYAEANFHDLKHTVRHVHKILFASRRLTCKLCLFEWSSTWLLVCRTVAHRYSMYVTNPCLAGSIRAYSSSPLRSLTIHYDLPAGMLSVAMNETTRTVTYRSMP